VELGFGDGQPATALMSLTSALNGLTMAIEQLESDRLTAACAETPGPNLIWQLECLAQSTFGRVSLVCHTSLCRQSA
jgi:hypothetical protein